MLMVCSAVCALMTVAFQPDAACSAPTANQPGRDGSRPGNGCHPSCEGSTGFGRAPRLARFPGGKDAPPDPGTFHNHEHGAVCAPAAHSAAPWSPSTVMRTGFACTFHRYEYGGDLLIFGEADIRCG